MAKISFKGNLIVLSCSMNIEKDVFNNGADDSIFEGVKTLFTQNGWSPISDLHHEPNGDEKVAICLEFTVPQNDVTTSSQWLHDTGMLMTAILHAICSVIDNKDTLKQISNNFHQVSVENGVVMLPAPKETKKQMYELVVYCTGDDISAFNRIMNTKYTSRTTWPQGFKFMRLEKKPMEELHEQLSNIGCEHAIHKV